MNDYYYGEQIDNFTFYRVPKALFTIPRYKVLSAEAKILYGLLLDRRHFLHGTDGRMNRDASSSTIR